MQRGCLKVQTESVGGHDTGIIMGNEYDDCYYRGDDAM